MSALPTITERVLTLDVVNDDGASDGESDSEEARIRREDRRLFKMPEILATHDARLQEPGPYRIPTRLLPSGAATPARHEDQLDDMPSRAPSPTIPPLPHFQMGSRAPTPDYIPFDPTHHQQRHSFTLSGEQLRQPTPLFIPDPDSRGPTPFSQHAESRGPTPALELRLQTPLFNEPLASFPDPTPSRPSKSPSPGFQYAKHTKRAHSLASDVDAERSDNEQSPRSRSSSPPPRKRTKTSYINTFAFLDLDAEQSGDDDEPDDPNEDEETLSDKGTS